jgi:serine/threonine protein kinase
MPAAKVDTYLNDRPISGPLSNHRQDRRRWDGGSLSRRDEQLERDIALKVLPAGTLTNESTRKQFPTEALALAKLNHPNIETIFEFSSSVGLDFLAMELIPGHTLSPAAFEFSGNQTTSAIGFG